MPVVAPNAQHGFDVILTPAFVALLQHGEHRIAVLATSSTSGCEYGWTVLGTVEQCVCDGVLCACPSDPALPVSVMAYQLTTASLLRPAIQLNDQGTGMDIEGFDSLIVTGIEITHATSGISVGGTGNGGFLAIDDCVFRGVFNRSSQVIAPS